jgi:hypothetical protein
MSRFATDTEDFELRVEHLGNWGALPFAGVMWVLIGGLWGGAYLAGVETTAMGVGLVSLTMALLLAGSWWYLRANFQRVKMVLRASTLEMRGFGRAWSWDLSELDATLRSDDDSVIVVLHTPDGRFACHQPRDVMFGFDRALESRGVPVGRARWG